MIKKQLISKIKLNSPFNFNMNSVNFAIVKQFSSCQKSDNSCSKSSCNESPCCGKCGRAYAVVKHKAPKFSGTAFWNGEFRKISNETFQNKYIVLFFYPLDLTFVCPTEIVAFNDMDKKFQEANAQVVACSIDSHFAHREWALKPRNVGGLSPVTIPMLSDLSQNISKSYGVRINEGDVEGASLRGTFIIDDKGVLRHSSINDLNVGRNVEEVLRLVQAFQHADKNGEVCPAKWTPGKATMTPGNNKKLDEYWQNEHAKKH